MAKSKDKLMSLRIPKETIQELEYAKAKLNPFASGNATILEVIRLGVQKVREIEVKLNQE